MIYKEKVTIPSTEKTIEHQVANCIKCGNDEIDIHEYEDQFGFISTAKCKNSKCGNEVKVNSSTIAVIEEWNNKNDIDTVIKNKELLIEKTIKEIKNLKELYLERNKKTDVSVCDCPYPEPYYNESGDRKCKVCGNNFIEKTSL